MDPENGELPFEERKWTEERALRDREIKLQEDAAARSRWSAPIVLAVAAAAMAGFFNGGVAWLNSRAQIALEDRKSEQARILQMISAPTPEGVRANLQFLLASRLLEDEELRENLALFLKGTQDSGLPTLQQSVVQFFDSKSTNLIAAELGIPSWHVDMSSDFIVIRPSGREPLTSTVRTKDFQSADYAAKLGLIDDILRQLRQRGD